MEGIKRVDKGLRYRQIREILFGGRQLTAKEIAVEMCNLGYVDTTERNWSAPRLTEMVDAGDVEIVGDKKCQYSGVRVYVYALKEKKHDKRRKTENQ